MDTVGLEIDARYNGLDVRKVAPELGKDNSRIDLIKLFDRDKGVKNANTRQIEARKKWSAIRELAECRSSSESIFCFSRYCWRSSALFIDRHLAALLMWTSFYPGGVCPRRLDGRFELLSALQITFRFFCQQL